MEVRSSHVKVFYKSLSCSLLVQNHKDKGFKDLRPRKLVHVGAWDGETMMASHSKGKKIIDYLRILQTKKITNSSFGCLL
jgi:hypothetical protein